MKASLSAHLYTHSLHSDSLSSLCRFSGLSSALLNPVRFSILFVGYGLCNVRAGV